MAGLSSCEPMDAKETASYSALHGKSFKELLKMEDDPMACKIISWTLTMDACQAATAFMGMSGGWNWKLPPAYAELPFAKREELSIEWLRKAHKLGDHEAALLLGNTICCDISENFHLDFRDGLDYLDEAERLHNLESYGGKLFAKMSPFLLSMNWVRDEQFLDHQQYGLGAMVATRCSDLLLDIIKDRPGVGLSKDDWGFKELHQIRDKRMKTGLDLQVKLTFPWSFLPHFMTESLKGNKGCGFKLNYKHNPNSLKYVTAPSYDPESAMNDLKRIIKGPGEVEKSDHVLLGCRHSHMEKLNRQGSICRLCYAEGFERARAVASGAYCMSKNLCWYIDTTMPHFSVLYEIEDGKGQRMTEKVFLGYCKAEVTTALRYLSLHSADVDPRMIILNPDLYWSIVWYYGSITKALKEAGGQSLYEIGFGKHEIDVSKDMKKLHFKAGPITLSLDLIPPFNLTADLISNNFVSKLKNKKTEWRYKCSHLDCPKLEDTKKFLSCSGCVNYFPRKYCSQECQEKNWEIHKDFCKSLRESKGGACKQQ